MIVMRSASLQGPGRVPLNWANVSGTWVSLSDPHEYHGAHGVEVSSSATICAEQTVRNRQAMFRLEEWGAVIAFGKKRGSFSYSCEPFPDSRQEYVAADGEQRELARSDFSTPVYAAAAPMGRTTVIAMAAIRRSASPLPAGLLAVAARRPSCFPCAFECLGVPVGKFACERSASF